MIFDQARMKNKLANWLTSSHVLLLTLKRIKSGTEEAPLPLSNFSQHCSFQWQKMFIVIVNELFFLIKTGQSLNKIYSQGLRRWQCELTFSPANKNHMKMSARDKAVEVSQSDLLVLLYWDFLSVDGITFAQDVLATPCSHFAAVWSIGNFLTESESFLAIAHWQYWHYRTFFWHLGDRHESTCQLDSFMFILSSGFSVSSRSSHKVVLDSLTYISSFKIKTI